MTILKSTMLLAAAIALTLGCTSVYADSEKTTMQQHVSNARHEAQISTTFALSPYLRSNDIQVAALNGKIMLTGHVADETNKELAGAIAAGVDGVKDVDNRIIVDRDYTAPQRSHANPRGYAQTVSDAEINAAIKSKLIWSKHADGMDLTVTTANGNVILAGNVATQQMKQLSEKLARDTNGVRSVDNKLVVSDKTIAGHKYGTAYQDEEGTMMSDTWITTKVKSSLLYSRNVSGFDIGVNTDKGVVTLDGRVNSGAEKALAVELAEHVRGVKSVNASKVSF